MYLSTSFRISELKKFKGDLRIVREPKERMGLRSLASTILIISLIELTLLSPFTLIPILMWLFTPSVRLVLWLVPIGGYILVFFTMFYSILPISNVMNTLKENKLKNIGKKIDFLERKISSITNTVKELMNKHKKLTKLRKQHEYEIRQYEQIKKMETSPIDLSIVIKLLSAAGAPLVSIIFKYLLPFF